MDFVEKVPYLFFCANFEILQSYENIPSLLYISRNVRQHYYYYHGCDNHALLVCVTFLHLVVCRVYTSFDVSVFVSTPAKLNVVFQGKSVSSVIFINGQCMRHLIFQDICNLSISVGGSSQLSVHQPWITKDDGYTTTFFGKLTNLEASTSLPYEPLGKAEMVNVRNCNNMHVRNYIL